MKSGLEKKNETLQSSVQKNKASILTNNEALKKAHRRTRGTLQQIEEIRHMLKSFKLRISEIRERHLSAKKDKHRNLIHRCDSFKIKQGVEVDNEINHSKSADFHIISKLFHHNASSFISLMMPRNRTRSLCCTIFSATIYCLSLLRSVGSGQKLKRSPHLTTRTGLNFRRCLNHFSPTFENFVSNSNKN